MEKLNIYFSQIIEYAFNMPLLIKLMHKMKQFLRMLPHHTPPAIDIKAIIVVVMNHADLGERIVLTAQQPIALDHHPLPHHLLDRNNEPRSRITNETNFPNSG